MDRQTEEKFKKDEEQDILLVKEITGKEKNMIKVANVLSQKFRQKYAPEFGGNFNIEFDIVEGIFKFSCGKDYALEIDENDVEDIPVRIKMFRKQAVEDKSKPKLSLIKKKDEGQKLKTEGGGEISVKVEKTTNAEKDFLEEDEKDEDNEEEEEQLKKPAQPARKK